jgi:hypothetical protein
VNCVDPWGTEVVGSYDKKTGRLTILDVDTGDGISVLAESGGKPFGDPIPDGEYDILVKDNDPTKYRLEPLDSHYGDDKCEKGGRKHFRLHGHGLHGRTIGCILVDDNTNWQSIQNLLGTTSSSLVSVESQSWLKVVTKSLQRLGYYMFSSNRGGVQVCSSLNVRIGLLVVLSLLSMPVIAYGVRIFS